MGHLATFVDQFNALCLMIITPTSMIRPIKAERVEFLDKRVPLHRVNPGRESSGVYYSISWYTIQTTDTACITVFDVAEPT